MASVYHGHNYVGLYCDNWWPTLQFEKFQVAIISALVHGGIDQKVMRGIARSIYIRLLKWSQSKTFLGGG